MLHVKELYLCGRRMQVGNGRSTSFRGDVWCDQCPLKDRFPDIYNISVEQKITVAKASWVGDSLSGDG
jgi:predicted metal-binding transcription factor (methanogenesis marker protein 9)